MSTYWRMTGGGTIACQVSDYTAQVWWYEELKQWSWWVSKEGDAEYRTGQSSTGLEAQAAAEAVLGEALTSALEDFA
jgi:hypothetical protein